MQCAIEEHKTPGVQKTSDTGTKSKDIKGKSEEIISEKTSHTTQDNAIAAESAQDRDIDPASDDYLRESSGHQGSLGALRSRLLEAFGTLSRRRNEHLLLQAQSATELSTYQHKRRFTEESILQLVATFSSQREEGMKSTPEQSFESIKAQLAGDGAELCSHSQTLMDVETRSSSTQYMVAEAETTFMTALRDFILNMPGGSDLWKDMNEAAERGREQASEASEEMPEPVQTYFDAAGNSQILQEQMIDLYHEHVDERNLRDLRRDQDDEPATPDSIFEERYESEQAELHERLNQALGEVKEARELCEEQGVDIESFRHRNDKDTSDVGDGRTPVTSTPYFVNVIGTGPLLDSSLQVYATDEEKNEPSGASRDDIQSWLERSSKAGGNPGTNNDVRNCNCKANRRTLRRYHSETEIYVSG